MLTSLPPPPTPHAPCGRPPRRRPQDGSGGCNVTAWNVAGYSPRSIRAAGAAGLLGESWASGSLRGALRVLLVDERAVPAGDGDVVAPIPGNNACVAH